MPNEGTEDQKERGDHDATVWWPRSRSQQPQLQVAAFLEEFNRVLKLLSFHHTLPGRRQHFARLLCGSEVVLDVLTDGTDLPRDLGGVVFLLRFAGVQVRHMQPQHL